jgi:hypothetical protein
MRTPKKYPLVTIPQEHTCTGVSNILRVVLSNKAPWVVVYRVEDMCSSQYGKESMVAVGGPTCTFRTLEQAFENKLGTELASTTKIPVHYYVFAESPDKRDDIMLNIWKTAAICALLYTKYGDPLHAILRDCPLDHEMPTKECMAVFADRVEHAAISTLHSILEESPVYIRKTFDWLKR